jgi:hypothetical protein
MPKLGLGVDLRIVNNPVAVTNFWANLLSATGKVVTGFFSIFTNPVTVNWGDGTTTPLTNGVSVNKTLGTTNNIGLVINNSIVSQINCGTSSPRLGGTVDISAFSNLQQFVCNSNDITSLSGYAQNSNLILLSFIDNKVTGSIPSLSQLTNLVEFSCDTNQLTGSIPSLSGLSNLEAFNCGQNQLTGSIPVFSSTVNLRNFYCANNQLTGSIPSLSGLNGLLLFNCNQNQLTGSIPALSTITNLRNFYCANNQLTGSIPSLSGLNQLLTFHAGQNFLTGTIPNLSSCTQLEDFRVNNCQLTNFAGGSVSNTCGTFQAQVNTLNQSSVDAILSAFDATTRTTGTRVLTLQGVTNAAPSYTGGATTTSPGSNFTRTGTLVTANVTNHRHPNGSLVTISAINETEFQGTFVITVVNANRFQYNTITSGTLTGTGTATMRRTSNPNDGFRHYQNLALVTRLGGYPWNVNIRIP